MKPTRTLVLASSPRTGSNMLCSILEESGLAGHADEILNPIMMVRDLDRVEGADFRVSPYWAWPILIGTRAIGRGGFLPRRTGFPELVRPSAVRPYLRRQQRLRTTPNGVFALKLHWRQWQRATEQWGITPDDLGPERTWVWLTRRDRLLQAVSMSIATQTGRWRASHTSNGVADYDADDIADWFDRLTANNDDWATWFDRNEITPILAPYEDVVLDLDTYVQRILGAIGERIDTVPAPTISRQTTDRNADWAERFLTERPEFAERRFDTSR